MAKFTKKQLQVGELIKRNFSMILLQEGSYIYGNDVLVSVTNVIMSSDLGIAKIYLSVYNTLEKDKVISIMEHHTKPLKHELAKRIRKHVRRIPNISFYIDETLDEIYKIDSIFDDLEKNNQMGSPDDVSDE